jgi:hypothetical protein
MPSQSEGSAVLPNLFETSESGFFTCIRVRPPLHVHSLQTFSQDDAAAQVVVEGPKNVVLTSKRAHLRTGEVREDEVFLVDGALGGDFSDDNACVIVLYYHIKRQ